MTGREWVQLISLLLSIFILGLIAHRIYHACGNWRAWVPLIINLVLTIIYYVAVWSAINASLLTDLSAALRLETLLTFLIYASYMPPPTKAL